MSSSRCRKPSTRSKKYSAAGAATCQWADRFKHDVDPGSLPRGDYDRGRPPCVAFALDSDGVRTGPHAGQIERGFADMLLVDEHGSPSRRGFDREASHERP